MYKTFLRVVAAVLMLVIVPALSFGGPEGQPACPREDSGKRMPMMQFMMPGNEEMMMRRPGPPPLLHYLGALDLSAKQKETVREIESKLLKESIRKNAEIELAELDLRDLLEHDAVDMSAIDVKLKKTESLKTEMRMSHIRAMEEVKALLTVEQKKKLKETMVRGPMRGSPTAWRDDDRGGPGL